MRRRDLEGIWHEEIPFVPFATIPNESIRGIDGNDTTVWIAVRLSSSAGTIYRRDDGAWTNPIGAFTFPSTDLALVGDEVWVAGGGQVYRYTPAAKQTVELRPGFETRCRLWANGAAGVALLTTGDVLFYTHLE